MSRKLLSWGANSYGQLGQGHCEDLLTPAEVDCKDVGFTPDQVTAIVGGGGHTLFITAAGSCYSCGSNNKGQLGQGSDEDHVTTPRPVTVPGNCVRKAAAGWDFTYLITDDKKLYSCGSNAFGQLGLEHVKDSLKEPREVLVQGEDVTDVSCGLRHTVILTASGHVYTCGSARKGQLGVRFDGGKLPRGVRKFTKVSLPQCTESEGCNVESVVAGAYHTAVLTDHGKVIVWGDNKHGQLTLDPSQSGHLDQPYTVQQSCFNGQKITKLATGWTHLVAGTKSGGIYTWGRSEYGQLGRGTKTTCDNTPAALKEANPDHLATGSEHNLITIDGTLYSWGWNEHGMCGSGDDNNILAPAVVQPLKDYKVTTVGCGAGHSFAVGLKNS